MQISSHARNTLIAMLRFILLSLLSGLSFQLAAAEVSKPQTVDVAVIQKSVESFVRAQTAGLPGQVNIVFGAVDAKLNLPGCNSLEAFIPTGGRLWGDSNVGVRCTTPSVWTIYVPVTVRVMANIVTTARPLSQGQTISAGDITIQIADLTKMPSGILNDPGQAIGKIITNSVTIGHPLRQDMLRLPPVILQGQTVKLLSQGPGFVVSSEGKALANAAEGQVIQVKTYSGEVVSGIARPGAIVEIKF